MASLQRGQFEVVNPYNGKVRVVPARSEEVHTIVFWSKNFGPFLEGGYGEELVRQGYNLFFNFTINSEDSWLEPNLPSLARRLEQMVLLAQRFGPRWLQWRLLLALWD